MFDRHPALDRKTIINLFSGNAVEGICTAVKPTYILRAATLHSIDAGAATPIDGEISVEPANVDFIQILD